MSIPPPDVAYDLPQFVRADNVFLLIVGYLNSEPEVEVFARSNDDFFRFYIPKHSKVLRDFWKNIGVTNVLRLKEGAYQDTRGGTGPYALQGMAIGEDLPLPEQELADDAVVDVARDDTAGEAPVQRSVGTRLLIAVKLEN